MFNAVLDKKTSIDRIVDFSHANDTMQLDKSIFQTLGASVTKTEFRKAGSVATAHALDNNDHLICNETNGALFCDPDGNGLLKQVQFAVLTGSPDDLAASDFILV
ncbi:hypothetical protein BH10PSE7_BH10PSE7_41520 [soil metagenome]